MSVINHNKAHHIRVCLQPLPDFIPSPTPVFHPWCVASHLNAHQSHHLAEKGPIFGNVTPSSRKDYLAVSDALDQFLQVENVDFLQGRDVPGRLKQLFSCLLGRESSLIAPRRAQHPINIEKHDPPLP